MRNYAQPFCDTMTTDLHGNLLLCQNPDADVRLMIAGHADQIGLIVSHVDDDGFIYTQTVGGWDPRQLIGQRMTVWTAAGPIEGVISRKAIHLMDEGDKKKIVKSRDLWIDVGADCEDEIADVQVGDPVTLKLGMQQLMNDRVAGPAMDNRAGLWVAVETLRRCSEMDLQCSLTVVSTVQEEVGLRGARTAAYTVKPDIGIAVDVTHATDCPTISKTRHGDIRLGRGPVIPRGPNINSEVYRRLRSIAAEHELRVQQKAIGKAAPNDGNALQISRAGVATGIIAIPNRYMHSAVEVVQLSDLDNAARLLAQFAASITNRSDFVPGGK